MPQPDFASFAPSAATAARAARLADPAFFSSLSFFENTFFGEMPAADDSQHCIVFQPNPPTNSTNPAFFCSCPFRPKPCVHALALALVFTHRGEAVFLKKENLPDWAEALLAGETAHFHKKIRSEEAKTADRERRRFERLERTAAGFDELENWLTDTLRRGLATAVSEDPRFFENIATRLADAGMGSGMGRRLRLLEAVKTSEPDWAERMLGTLADAYLALRAFRRRDALPENLLFDLQNFIGISTKKEEVAAAGEHVEDLWATLGVHEEMVEDKLAARRTWLLGARSGRSALLLDYAYLGAADLPPGMRTGDIFEARLVFYPSNFPLRALLDSEPKLLQRRVEKIPGSVDFQAFAQQFAEATGRQPWLSAGQQGVFPAAFSEVVPVFFEKKFWLTDAAGRRLPLDVEAAGGWQFLASSGGHPLSVFGEWDGFSLKPLSICVEGRLVAMPGLGLRRTLQTST